MKPSNNLSQDEIDLVEMVLGYHAKTKYNYKRQVFTDDMSTQYAYYKELDFFDYIKMVMFIINNINQFDMTGLTYDISSNTFMNTRVDGNGLRVVNIFRNGDNIVENEDGTVALNKDVIDKVSKFLCDYVFHIQDIRENVKTIS